MKVTAKMAKKQEKEKHKQAPRKDSLNELREALWSVVSFEKCEASGLTYTQAEQKLGELAAEKVSGLCIVTDEAAARIVARK